MANFYLDVSAIGNEYQAYADTPTTWAVPQDGNGKAGPGHSAAVAVGTIDCASASCSGAGQLLILGTSVSSTLTGSGATLATNIAAAINASSTSVTATYSAALLPINRLVYARVHPTVNTTVQIMLRIAGADWNGMTHATAGTWGTTPTMGAFAGGANGPFAYFINNGVIFGKAVHTGGIFTAKSLAVNDPSSTGSDPILVRTKRSGVSLSCALTSTTASIFVQSVVGVYRSFIFDNGVTWSGDNGVFLASFQNTVTDYTRLGLRCNGSLLAKEKWGMKVTWEGKNTSYGFYLSSGTTNVYTNIEFAAINATNHLYLHECTGGCYCTVIGCKFNLKTNISLSDGLNSNAYSCAITAIDCDFLYTLGANLNLLVNGTPSWGYMLRLDGCRFVVDGGLNSIANITNVGLAWGFLLVIENCTGIPNKLGGLTASPSIGQGQYYWAGKEEGRSYRYESPVMVIDWDNTGVYPTYTTTTPEGAPFGARISWAVARTSASWMTSICRLVTVHTDTAAVRTFTLEMLVNTTTPAELPNKAQLVCVCKYTGADGARYTIIAGEPVAYDKAGIASALSAGVGTGAWTLNGVTGTTSVKIAVTTPNAVMSNSRVEMSLYFCAPPAADRLIYLNPEILVT